jgi:uncharacterized protein YacL
MKQSKMDSLMESVVNIVIGLIISTIANYLLLQLFLGFPMHLGTNVLISVVFTVISLVRSYSLRRAFNGRSVWSAIKEKFNVRQVPNDENPRVVNDSPWSRAARLADVRRGSVQSSDYR